MIDTTLCLQKQRVVFWGDVCYIISITNESETDRFLMRESGECPCI